MSIIIIYLLSINSFGFIMFLINIYLYSKYNGNKNVDEILTYTSFLGGTLGIVISMIIFDRSFKKENMMSRVFAYSMLIIQIVLFFIVKEGIIDGYYFEITNFFLENRLLSLYLVVINLVCLSLFGIDKYKSIQKKSRIPNYVLIGTLFIGGSIGGIVGMKLFHHKTNKDYYTVGIKYIMIMHILLIFYLLNN